MNLLAFAFVTAFLISSTLIVLIIKRFDRGLSYRQRSLRDTHHSEVSRFGGIGIAAGFFGTMVLLKVLSQQVYSPHLPNALFHGQLVTFLMGGVAIFLLGLIDDIWNIRVRYKMLGQILITAGIIWLGITVDRVAIPLFGMVELGQWKYPITAFWIVGMMNAVNLIDGLDGLASGICIVALLFFIAIALLLGTIIQAFFFITLLGATLGFWVFNKPPASIFMGDSGSLLLGYCLSITAIWFVNRDSLMQVNLISVLILSIPIIDTLFALFRRYLKGIPFYSADRDHMHHRLVDMGYSPKKAMMIMMVFGTGFGLLGLGLFQFQHLYSLFCLLGVLFAYFILLFLEYDEIKNPIQSLKASPILKRQRSFVISLSENIEDLFKLATTFSELINGFSFWASQMKLNSYSIHRGGRILYEQAPTIKDLEDIQELIFEIEGVKVQIQFASEAVKIDSDVKGTLIEHVTQQLVVHLNRLPRVSQSSRVIQLASYEKHRKG